jgi:hypothetical protein
LICDCDDAMVVRDCVRASCCDRDDRTAQICDCDDAIVVRDARASCCDRDDRTAHDRGH